MKQMNWFGKRLVLAMTLSALALGSVMPAAFAEHGNWGGRGASKEQRQAQMQAMLDELGLSGQQKQELKSIMEARRQGKREKHEALRAKRKQLMDMMRSGSSSKEDALRLQREISEQQNALMADHINSAYRIREVLTPEQYQKFQAKMEAKRSKMKGHRRGDKGPEGGPGGPQ